MEITTEHMIIKRGSSFKYQGITLDETKTGPSVVIFYVNLSLNTSACSIISNIKLP